MDDPLLVEAFWECLETFCLASGSVINHSKTSYKCFSNNTPQVVVSVGCKETPSGQIFRLLGIPMGFGISLKERWIWVMDKFKAKLLGWKGYQPNLSARLFVLNHCFDTQF